MAVGRYQGTRPGIIQNRWSGMTTRGYVLVVGTWALVHEGLEVDSLDCEQVGSTR